MNLELENFSKQELIRVCQLVGYTDDFSNYGTDAMINMILEKVHPGYCEKSLSEKEQGLRQAYIKALELFGVKPSQDFPGPFLKEKLYIQTRNKLEESMSKMSEEEKRKLADQLEGSLDPTVLEKLKSTGKPYVVAGGGILLLQGGAIAITGANLGICMLLTSSLSMISGVLGITFPFAAYTTAAVVGGYIIQAGHLLASPWTAIPILGITTYLLYKKTTNKKYINLAGVNYLIESKKLLGI